MFADVSFSVLVFTGAISAVLAGIVLWFLDRAVRMVTELWNENAEDRELEHATQRAADAFLFGLEPDEEGRQGMPAFITEVWPAFVARFVKVEKIVLEEFSSNGGSSTKDMLREILRRTDADK